LKIEGVVNGGVHVRHGVILLRMGTRPPTGWRATRQRGSVAIRVARAAGA